MELGKAEAEGVCREGKTNCLGAQLTQSTREGREDSEYVAVVFEEGPVKRARSWPRWWLSVGELRGGHPKSSFHINPVAFDDVGEDRYADLSGKVEQREDGLVDICPVAVVSVWLPLSIESFLHVLGLFLSQARGGACIHSNALRRHTFGVSGH